MFGSLLSTLNNQCVKRARSKSVHIMLFVDPDTRTGVCQHCGPVSVKKKKTGYLCPVSQRRWTNANRKYRPSINRDRCSRCGFVPEDQCQIDIHHLDGNHENNDPSNLAAICANCHRLIHHRQNQQVRIEKISQKQQTLGLCAEGEISILSTP